MRKRTKRKFSAAQWAAFTQQGRGRGAGKGGKAGGKGQGGGKGKGKCKPTTPDGVEICFAFNDRKKKCNGQCGRLHVCGVCFKENSPMYSCNHQP